MAALVAAVLLAGAVIWLQDRQNQRLHTLVEAHRLEVLGLVERAATERADLLQRIQAPEVAVAQHATSQPVETPPAVSPEDDEGYWKAQDDVTEALERIAVMEREGLA